MNTTVSILICYRERGRRKTASAAYAGQARLKPGIGCDRKGREFPCPGGVYYIRWYQGKKQVTPSALLTWPLPVLQADNTTDSAFSFKLRISDIERYMCSDATPS